MPTQPNKRGGDRESTKQEFRIIIVKMIQNLENKMEINRLETRIEKMQEMFNKDPEEIKKESITKWALSRDARILQYPQINQCNTTH